MPEPEWLSDQEQSTWRALVAMIRTVNEQVEHQLLRDAADHASGLRSPRALSEHTEDSLRNERPRPNLGWSQSRLSHAMAWLGSPAGCGASRARPTSAATWPSSPRRGGRKLTEAAPGHVAAVRHLVFDALTGEQQRILVQISEAITAHADAPTP